MKGKHMKNSESIRIGFIRNCMEGKDYGVLASYLCYSRLNGTRTNAVILYYTFKKNITLELTAGTIVCFISINDQLGQASQVIPITKLPFLSMNTNQQEIEIHNHRLLPYWAISDKSKTPTQCSLCMPLKKRKNSQLSMHSKQLIGKDLEVFLIIYALSNSTVSQLSLEDHSRNIKKWKEYVDEFNLEEVLSTYKCGREGHFQYRPGRDDSFNITYFKTIDTDDMFIRSLIPLGIEHDYYACVGKGIGDEDYYRLDEEDMSHGKQLVRENYTKEKHLAFMITSELENYYMALFEYQQLLQKLNSIRSETSIHSFSISSYSSVVNECEYNNTKALEQYKYDRL